MYLILNQSKFHFLLFKSNFNIIPTYTPVSCDWHLPVAFSSCFVCFCHSPFVLRSPTMYPPLFERRTVCWRVHIVKYTIFFSLLLFLCLLSTCFLLAVLFWNTCSFGNQCGMWRRVAWYLSVWIQQVSRRLCYPFTKAHGFTSQTSLISMATVVRIQNFVLPVYIWRERRKSPALYKQMRYYYDTEVGLRFLMNTS
jgi:hypothetical protein